MADKSINQKRGPTVGNAGKPGKRAELATRRDEAQGLADTINNALAARGGNAPKVDPKLDSIAGTVKPRKFSK